MKQIISILSVVVVMMILSPFQANAENTSNEEIKLTVSSDGPTKDDAVKNALRTAIEQAYGAFVSANTTILNDELVKDEIVTISNGAIKEFSELSSFEKSEGGYCVTLNATVSLPHLITYAKSHGSECEFAGNAFGMQMKLFEIQKKNELTALNHLSEQILAAVPSCWEYKLYVEEPKVHNDVFWVGDYEMERLTKRYSKKQLSYCAPRDAKRDAKRDPNEVTDAEAEAIINEYKVGEFYAVPMSLTWTQTANPLSDENVKLMATRITNIYVETYRYQHATFENTYPIKYDEVKSGNYSLILMYDNVLRDISMDEKEYCKLLDYNVNASKLFVSIDGRRPNRKDIGSTYYLRNDYEIINKWKNNLISKIYEKYLNFYIIDNTGQKSDPYVYEMFRRIVPCEIDHNVYVYHNPERKYSDEKRTLTTDQTTLMTSEDKAMMGTGLFRLPFICDMYWKRESLFGYSNINVVEWPLSLKFTVLIPKSEIGKYSSFKVVPKN